MATPMTTSDNKIGSRVRMGYMLAQRDALRYQKSLDLLDAALVDFRSATLGLGKRFQFRGAADMLAGKRECPQATSVRYLTALRQAGLGREQAERYVLWHHLAVAHIWRDDQTPLAMLEEREQEAENACNLAHLRCLADNTPENRRRLYEARLAEAAAEMACLTHPDAR